MRSTHVYQRKTVNRSGAVYECATSPIPWFIVQSSSEFGSAQELTLTIEAASTPKEGESYAVETSLQRVD